MRIRHEQLFDINYAVTHAGVILLRTVTLRSPSQTSAVVQKDRTQATFWPPTEPRHRLRIRASARRRCDQITSSYNGTRWPLCLSIPVRRHNSNSNVGASHDQLPGHGGGPVRYPHIRWTDWRLGSIRYNQCVLRHSHGKVKLLVHTPRRADIALRAASLMEALWQLRSGTAHPFPASHSPISSPPAAHRPNQCLPSFLLASHCTSRLSIHSESAIAACSPQGQRMPNGS